MAAKKKVKKTSAKGGGKVIIAMLRRANGCTKGRSSQGDRLVSRKFSAAGQGRWHQTENRQVGAAVPLQGGLKPCCI